MAVGKRVPVGQAATRVSIADSYPRQVFLRVIDADATVQLGGSTVTATTGLPVADTDGLVGPITLGANEHLWAVAETGTPVVAVLEASVPS